MLKFHAIHGANICIDLEGQRATRLADSFCDGITFSHETLVIGELYCLLVLGRPDDSDWSGALRLGVTTVDPSSLAATLPKYACPDLITKSGFWARPIKEELAKDKSRIGLCINTLGEMQLTVNNHLVGSLFNDLPTDVPLWMIIDVYGSTQSVQFVQEDNIPAEILARGPAAVEAYVGLRKRGNAPLFRGRIFMLGQDRASNNRFQEALLLNNANEAKLDKVVQCHHWISINNKGQLKKAAEEKAEKKKQVLKLEQDYDNAIARNIAMEILKNKQKKVIKASTNGGKRRILAADISRPTLVAKNALLRAGTTDFKRKGPGSGKVAPSTTGLSHDTTAAFYKQLPANMLGLVEHFLKELESQDQTVIVDIGHCKPEDTLATDINVSLWKLGGHADLMPAFLHFLSQEAVYILTFDLSQDLNALADKELYDPTQDEWVKGQAFDMTNLDYIIRWISLIHHKSRMMSDPNECLNNVIIVGTNRASLHPDPRMQESLANMKFEVIREVIRGQSMEKNVCQTFFAVDENDVEHDEPFDLFKIKLYHSLLRLPRMGQRIPEMWVDFDNCIKHWMLVKGIPFAHMDEIFEAYSDQDLLTFQSLLSLYCDLGMIFIVDKIVIFDTQSFATLLTQLTSPHHFAQLKTRHLDSAQEVELNGWLSWNTFNAICVKLNWETRLVSNVLEALCLLYIEEDSICFLPHLNICELEDDNLEQEVQNSVCVFYEFGQHFPNEAFYMLIVTLLKGNLSIESYQMTSANVFTFHCDAFHQIRVELLSNESSSRVTQNLLKVDIRRKPTEHQIDGGSNLHQPSPQVCSHVTTEIGNCLASLCSQWFPRLTFLAKVLCSCGSVCDQHQINSCTESQCLHLVSLDEVLSSTMIWCGHKQVNTITYRKKFSVSASELPVLDIEYEPTAGQTSTSLSLSPPDLSTLFHLRPPSTRSRLKSSVAPMNTSSPSWLRGASKLLDSGFNNDSWRQLGQLLGYKEAKLDQLEESSYQPSKSLLKDWLETSQAKELSTEMLLACLKEMRRFDVIDVIKESEEEARRQSKHDVFISYQWDNQKDVMLIRAKLEQAGFSCWMDIGQMGGGDQLYNEIYKGIFHAQVMLVFISPRFILSDYCQKEVNLADLLRLPIIPVMIEKTPWPPPGSLAVILSQHLYVDLAGTGGHGGCGKDADWSIKLRELIRRLRLYTSVREVAHKTPVYDTLEASIPAPVGSTLSMSISNVSPPPPPQQANENVNESFENEETNSATESTWGHPDPGRVPCCVNVMSLPTFCAIL